MPDILVRRTEKKENCLLKSGLQTLASYGRADYLYLGVFAKNNSHFQTGQYLFMYLIYIYYTSDRRMFVYEFIFIFHILDRPMCEQPPPLKNGAFHIVGNGTIKAGFTATYK